MRIAKLAVAGMVVAASMFVGGAGNQQAEAHPASTYHWHYVEFYPGVWGSCLYSPAGHLVYCSNVSSFSAPVVLDK